MQFIKTKVNFNWSPWYSWNIAESGTKTQNINQSISDIGDLSQFFSDIGDLSQFFSDIGDLSQCLLSNLGPLDSKDF